MIGTLINKFDNAEDITVKSFNEVFSGDLSFDENFTVEIGDLRYNGFRELTVTDLQGKEYITSMQFNPKVAMDLHEPKYLYNVIKDGIIVNTLENRLEVIETYNISNSTLSAMFSNPSKVTRKGYRIARINNRNY